MLVLIALVLLRVPVASSAPFRYPTQAAPQRSTADVPTGRDSDGEYTSFVSDDIINRTRSTDDAVIVISHLGRGEAARYGPRRLHNAISRLAYYGHGVPRERIIPALGERVDGPGRVDYYLGGQLVYRVTFRKNRDFVVDCCDEDLRRGVRPGAMERYR